MSDHDVTVGYVAYEGDSYWEAHCSCRKFIVGLTSRRDSQTWADLHVDQEWGMSMLVRRIEDGDE